MIRKILAVFLFLVLALPVNMAYNQDTYQDSNGCVCTCPPPPQQEMPKIDVVFLIDSTGSMGDEIRTVKTHIMQIVKEVQLGQPRPEFRVGIVSYRDHELEEREYLYRMQQLTYDIDEALEFLVNIEAQGGGDYPEAVADGLHVAINDLNWKTDAKKMIFLVGDAAPHGIGSSDSSYHQGCPNGFDYRTEIENAVNKKITIYTVSGSGMDQAGIKVWQEIASNTGGSYQRLSYVREDVDQYYAEEGIDPLWAAEAKKDTDYDAETNTILTNTLGIFAKSSIMQEAKEMGVRYDGSTDSDSAVDENDSWLDGSDITGIKDTIKAKAEKKSFSSFLRNAFEKIKFWK